MGYVAMCHNVKMSTDAHSHTHSHTLSHTHLGGQKVFQLFRENHPLGYLRQATLVYCLGSTHVHIVIYRACLVSAQLWAQTHTHTRMSMFYLCMYVCTRVLESHTYYLLCYKIIRAFSSFFGFISFFFFPSYSINCSVHTDLDDFKINIHKIFILLQSFCFPLYILVLVVVLIIVAFS